MQRVTKRKPINVVIFLFIKTLKLPGTDKKFRDRTHFYSNVNLDSQEQILDGFKAVVSAAHKDKKSPDLYVIRDADITLGMNEEEIIFEQLFSQEEYYEPLEIMHELPMHDEEVFLPIEDIMISSLFLSSSK